MAQTEKKTGDGLGLNNDEFVRLFAEAVSLSPFQKFYADRESCYNDYADRLGLRFNTASENCVICGSHASGTARMASWKVAYQNRKSFSKNLIGLILTPLGFSMIARMTLRFSTLHSICTGCARKATTRRLLTSPLILLTEFLALLSLIGFVAGGATMLIATRDDPPSQQLITIFCASLVSLPLMLWFRLRLRHSVIPKTLRIIAKRPIEFLGLTSIRTK